MKLKKEHSSNPAGDRLEREAIETVLKGGFEIDFLMLVVAIGAAVLGEWAEGALLFSYSASGTHWSITPWGRRANPSPR